MRSQFTKFFLFSFFFFSSAFAVIPSSASAAGLIPCGRTIGSADEQAPCTICHVVIGGNRIIEYGLQIMTVTAIAVIVAMAIFYIISTGDEGMMKTAKGGIKAALIGFAVMLSAWLLVNVILTLLVNTQFLDGIRKDGAFSFTCDATSSTGAGVGGAVIAGAGAGGAGGAVSSAAAGGASCIDPAPEKTRMNTSGSTVCNNSGFCPSCNTSAFESYISTYGNPSDIPLSFIRGMIARESSCVTTSVKTESNSTQSCGLMQVNTASSPYTCAELQIPETGIKEGVRILKAAFVSANSLKSQYGNTVTVNELAAAIHNAGAGQSGPSNDCSSGNGWPTIPKWGCPINPGTATFNACNIKSYACNVGAC